MLYNRQIYVTSSTLDGVCKGLTVEDGDENQARQLSACAAWVQDQGEDADELEEFVMSEVSTIQARKDEYAHSLGASPKLSSQVVFVDLSHMFLYRFLSSRSHVDHIQISCESNTGYTSKKIFVLSTMLKRYVFILYLR